MRLHGSRVRRGLAWLCGTVLGLVLLLSGSWYLLFRVNQFSLAVELNGEADITLEYGQAYEEPGAAVVLYGTLFWQDGFFPGDVILDVEGEVQTDALGRYTLSYVGTYGCLTARVSRFVNVIDTQSPVITLTADPEGSLQPGKPYEEAGFTASDNYDGDITDRVLRIVELDKVTYAVEDSSGNFAYVEREIPYYDPIPPEITLIGGDRYVISAGTHFVDPGYSAVDNADGDITSLVTVSEEVDWLNPGIYPVTYQVTDSFQNETTVIREVEVVAMPRPQIVWPENKTIYLTFDDGPGPYTKRLLNILDQYGVKATFFVTDNEYGYLMKEIVERGHSIGIHTVSHDYKTIYASPEAYFQDLHRMQEIIFEHTGVWTTLMRFPGGSSNTVSRRLNKGLMTTLTRVVQDAGYQFFDWNVDSDDAGSAKKTKTVRANVQDGIRREGIAMVLQHDIYDYSVNAVEDIIIWALDRGYTFRALTPNTPGFHHGVQN